MRTAVGGAPRTTVCSICTGVRAKGDGGAVRADGISTDADEEHGAGGADGWGVVCEGRVGARFRAGCVDIERGGYFAADIAESSPHQSSAYTTVAVCIPAPSRCSDAGSEAATCAACVASRPSK